MRSIGSAFLLCWPLIAFAQPQPDTLWTRHLGGAADEMVNVLCTDGEGGYVVAGHCGFNGDEMGPQDFFVCRTDSAGFPLWQQVFGGADTNEFAYAAMATANGDVVMAGRDFSYDGLTVVPHLVRLNGEGEIVWNRTYDGATHAQFYGLCELPDGDIIAGGFHYLPGPVRTST